MSDTILDQVRAQYAAVAGSGLSSDHAGVRGIAAAFGYSPEELAAIPAEANMGLSCGNPTASAHLRPGEVVVDLGCGGGLDVLLAAQKVGPTGKAIGIDMTPEMVALARTNAAKANGGGGLANVEFHLSTIDQLPLPGDSADCIISNCVINLAPDKASVFREMWRVLKPGGRVAVSDIALKKPLPREIIDNVLAYVACVSGAIPIAEYERGLKEAGFESVLVVDTKKDLNAYGQVDSQAGCCSPPMASLSVTECCEPAGGCCTPPGDLHAMLGELLKKYDFNEYAASVQVYALKAR